MDRHSVTWRGYWPAAPTPFTRDGALDERAWRELLRLYRSQGMHGILVNGTTGEWFAQSDAERMRLAEIATEELGGTLTVVIGCTSYTARQTAELARHARSVGADGVLSTPPPYAHPNPEELVQFYRDISDATDIPIMVYNWPRGVAVEIQTETVVRLAEVANVVAIKNSTANRNLLLETLAAAGDQLIYFGDFVNPAGVDVLRTMGGDGYIGGGGLLGRENPEFFEAVWRGDLQRARELGAKSVKLLVQLMNPDWSGKYGSPQAWLKAAMNLLGQPGGWPRRPLLAVTDEHKLAAIRRALESVGLEVREPVGVA
jgi:dihydrodipicolinate synthase/N-acetylneuraminate lyase